jgi:4-hydroxy-3-methylbut-2-enyl diphosphate reductase
MSEVIVAAPLRIEAALFSSAARGALVRKTGMGPARARAAASALAGDRGGALLVVGFCGGLDSGSVPGEVIIPEHVYPAHDEGHAEEGIRCDLAGELVTHLAGRGMKLRSGPIVCVSKIAVGERRAELHERGAIGVDMESVWLGAAAADRRFGVVRVVLDSPSHELFRVRALVQAVRAARALRGVARALHEWSPAV